MGEEWEYDKGKWVGVGVTCEHSFINCALHISLALL